MGKPNPGGPLDWGFPTGRGNPGRGSCKGILKGTSPPEKKEDPYPISPGKIPWGAEKKFLEEKGGNYPPDPHFGAPPRGD